MRRSRSTSTLIDHSFLAPLALLLSRSVPITVVSEMLGHADVGITLSIYAHVLPAMQDGAADAMDEALG